MKQGLSPEEYILATATRLEVVANKYVFHPMNISFMSVKILGYLSCSKKATPTDILNSVGGTRSNISQRLNYLEKEGYIIRTFAKFSDDKRKVVIKITNKGNNILEEVSQRLSRAQKALKSRFTKKELEDNEAFCKKMMINLDSKNPKLEEVFKM